MDRDQLLAKVFAQLEEDINNRDFTAIEELLKDVTIEQLHSFLAEYHL
jgi:hypothetical protein